MGDDSDFELARSYYSDMSELGFTRDEADSLGSILEKCWKRDGAFGAVVGGVAGGVIGGTVTLGTLAVPGWVLGIAVGGAEGTLICANKPVRAMARHEKALLSSKLKRIMDLEFLTAKPVP
jgi:hypothetical protein